MEIMAIVFAKHRFHYQKVVDGPHDREWEISSARQFSFKIRHILRKKLGGKKKKQLCPVRECVLSFNARSPQH